MITIQCFPCGPLDANCYIVGNDSDRKGFMVDPGGSDEAMERYLAEQQFEMEYIILTHGHADHIGGVAHYKKLFPHVRVVAGAAEKELLRDARKNFSKAFCREEVSLETDLSVKDGDTLTAGSIVLRFIETPGHTKGGLSIYVPEAKAVFSGDTLFAQSIGRTDFPGGSAEELTASIREKLYKLPDDTAVYPGHMGKTTIQIEKEYNPFV